MEEKEKIRKTYEYKILRVINYAEQIYFPSYHYLPIFKNRLIAIFSYHIGKILIKVPYIALVNLIAGRKIVPELIQEDLNAETLEKELKIILSEEASNEMKSNFETLITNLGTTGASDRAAEIIIKS